MEEVNGKGEEGSGGATPITNTRLAKPDQDEYKREMSALSAEVDTVQAKVNAVREKIAGATGKGSSKEQERRSELRGRLDEIRKKQSGTKGEKQAKLDQLRSINESIKKRTAEIQTLKGKLQYRNSSEVDVQIKSLESQVESGRMKLIDEKRALAEINTLKKSKKVFESFTTIQAAIDEDRQKSETLRASLDDPESKALSAEHDKIKAELDELHKASNDAYSSRQTLFDERDALSKQIGDLYTKKREAQKAYRTSNDKWYSQMKEDREKKDARRREEMAKEDDERRQEYFAAQLEEASTPAFGEEIFICENLITYFEGGKNKSSTAEANALSRLTLGSANLPKLQARQVEAFPVDVQTIGRKSGKMEEEESLFAGSKKKGRKGAAAGAVSERDAAAQPTNAPLKLDLVVMDQLRTMDVTIPLRQDEVPAVVKTLRQKVEWFKMNNDVVTEQILAGVKDQQAKALDTLEKERKEPAEASASTTTSGKGGRQHSDRRERHTNFVAKGSDAKGISARVKRAALSTLSSTNGAPSGEGNEGLEE